MKRARNNRDNVSASRNIGMCLKTFLLQRIKKISDYLEGGLHKSFKSGLINNDKNSVTQCLRIFTTLGRVDQSEQLFADAIIAPIIEEVAIIA